MTTTDTPPPPARWSIRHSHIRPADLEIGWETTPSGETYSWQQARLDNTVTSMQLDGTNDSYGDALVRAINELKSLPTAPAGYVTVASINVSEEGGMNFIASGMTPVMDTIEFTRNTLLRL